MYMYGGTNGKSFLFISMEQYPNPFVVTYILCCHCCGTIINKLRKDDVKLGQNKNVANGANKQGCMKIGTEPINAIMVADDLALIETSTQKLKESITLAEDHANKRKIYIQ